MSDAEPRNPFTRRGFVLGGVLIAGLAAAAIVLAFTSIHSDTGTTAAVTTSTPVVTATVKADPATESVCGLPGYDITNTLTAAPETKWGIVGTMAAPVSTTVGPGTTGTDGVLSCYAHTSSGALFAVANSWAMGTDARLAPLAEAALLIPGPGRDAAIAAHASGSSGGLAAQIAGYKILSYTGTDAVVDIAFRLSNGTMVSVASGLEWVDRDWKFVVTDDGQPPYDVVLLQSLGGYTPWAGVA